MTQPEHRLTRRQAVRVAGTTAGAYLLMPASAPTPTAPTTRPGCR